MDAIALIALGIYPAGQFAGRTSTYTWSRHVDGVPEERRIILTAGEIREMRLSDSRVVEDVAVSLSSAETAQGFVFARHDALLTEGWTFSRYGTVLDIPAPKLGGADPGNRTL